MNQHINESANSQTNQLTSLPAFQPPSLPTIIRWILLGGLLLAAVGAAFAPWVARPPAALMLTAPDLAEFVKFLPDVRNGSLRVYRLLFLLPLFTATSALPLFITAQRLAYPGWVRWPVLVSVVPLSLVLLPPVWSPTVLLSSEFRLQTIACAVCLGLITTTRWLGHTPRRLLIRLFLPLALAAPALAFWQFFVVRAAISRAYAGPILPGWGAWATVFGFVLTALAALLAMRRLSLTR